MIVRKKVAVTPSPVPVYNRPPINCGRPAMIPAKMMMEMPLPTPFSLISSPSQTRNIVPAVIVMIAESVGKASGPESDGWGMAPGAMLWTMMSCP